MQPMANVALRAARQAGQIIMRAFDRVDQLTIEEKAHNDFVSAVDRDAERAIVDHLRKAFPSHGFLGEELGAVEGGSEFTWIIDPLDGTL
ncbi:MAG: inositol monophosphatase family protein, partial [Gammaproteobacteria bacterium]